MLNKLGTGLQSRLKSLLDFLAVAGPIICLVDCLLIPILLLVLPLVGIHQVFHGIGDQVLVFVVLALCAPSLIPGYLKHRKKRVLACMVLGFAFIFLANFLEHGVDEWMHLGITILGSSMLIKANADNRKFSKCCHGHHH